MSAVSLQSAAWEDRITVVAQGDVIYVKELVYDPKLQITGGFVRVRGPEDRDDGPRSDIVGYVKGRLIERETYAAGLRLKSREGMHSNDRIWVYIQFNRQTDAPKKMPESKYPSSLEVL